MCGSFLDFTLSTLSLGVGLARLSPPQDHDLPENEASLDPSKAQVSINAASMTEKGV